MKKKHPKVGMRILIVRGKHYLGMKGKIEYCGKCCRAYRIQFDEIANNEKLVNFRGKYVFIN